MKKILILFVFLLTNISLAASNDREIFGKLIIKVDKKKFFYHRPGSFTEKFYLRPDQALVVSKGKKKISIVLTQVTDVEEKSFEDFCNKSFQQVQLLQKNDLSKFVQKDKFNCQIFTETKKDSTLQWLHKYTFKKSDFILSLSTTQVKLLMPESVTFIEDFLKENTYELR